jgi:TonB family protein
VQEPPILPPALQRNLQPGSVKVSFDVQPDGTTSDVKVASSTNRRLNAASVAAVSSWRFQPIGETRSLEIDFVFGNE